MHRWVIYVGAPNVTGEEKFFGPDPAEDRTHDPPHENPTLYYVAIKAGLYCKAVQACYISIPCDTSKHLIENFAKKMLVLKLL